eukprot:Gb_19900 [translate_table: standard]
MAAVFFYHVVGDLTVGKPELVEFPEYATVADAIVKLRDCTECGIPVWKQRALHVQTGPESADARQDRFIGILSALDIIAHLSTERSLTDPDAALKVPVSEIVIPNNSLLRQVAPATRLVDALEIMKQGVRRLLVPRTVGWRGMSKRFSVLYNGKWLNPIDGEEAPNENWCCLSREDVIRFLIGCLGALAPIPLTSIQSLGAISKHVFTLDSRSPARDAIKVLRNDPQAIAVVENNDESDGSGGFRIIGEISAFKLWKCDHVSAAWALTNLTAGEFVMGVEDIVQAWNPSSSREPIMNKNKTSDQPKAVYQRANSVKTANGRAGGVKVPNLLTVKEEGSKEKPKVMKRFSSRSLDFVNLYFDHGAAEKSSPRPYRGRSAPLTCRPTNSLAAVMAQMLSHRATHVWVTHQQEEEGNDNLVGIISYSDILSAVTKPPNSVMNSN